MLNYEIVGEGKPLLLVHGFLESKDMWKYLDLLSLNRKCILIDLPGHGKSQLTDPNEPSIEFLALEVKKLIDFLALENIDFIGHSMGGYVCLELMKLIPSSQRLILLNSNFWADSEEKKKSRLQVADVVWKSKSLFIQTAIPNLFWNKKDHQKEMDALVEEANQMTPFSIAYCALAMRGRKNFSKYVAKNTNKIYVLQGQNDATILLDEMNLALANKGNFHIIQNCGHMSHIEKSDDVTRLIKTILNEQAHS